VFAEPEAGISPGLGCRYKNFGDFALEYDPAANAMAVRTPTVSLRLRNETRAFRSLMRAKVSLSTKFAALALRAAYFLTLFYFKGQRIRLYYDKIHTGGDNGRYLFEYSSDRCRAEGGPVGRHRYLASNRSGEYIELKRGGYKVHACESPYRKLIALHADLIFSTYPDVKDCVGLNNFEKRWCADLFSARVICVQHGLTVRRIPRYRARYIDNTELYFCASGKEVESLCLPEYGYEPSMLRVTGLPRFDGLISYPENIILLVPARRRPPVVRDDDEPGFNDDDIEPGSRDDDIEPGSSEGDNGATPTDSFGAYRRLLTDEGLLSFLEAHGFRLALLLRPPLSDEAERFEEYVALPVEMIVSERKDYEQYLNQASALITDYDDIQYDFAYMEKPVIYYRPPDLPPPYESDVFDYEAEGFGPIVSDMAELVERLSELTAEDDGGDGAGSSGRDAEDESDDNTDAAPDAAPPQEVYLERARAFFAYRDRENRGRIYDEIEKDYG
jgi:hypothetical protein